MPEQFTRADSNLLATLALEVNYLKNSDLEKEKRIESLENQISNYDRAAAKMGGIGIALIGVFSVVLYGWDSIKDKLIGFIK